MSAIALTPSPTPLQSLAGSTFQEIPLASLFPSPTNPRKTFTGPGFDSLVASIREQGVLQPILVRIAAPTEQDRARALEVLSGGPKMPAWPSVGGGYYEIVCGERRYRASVVAGKVTIPALVRELTDLEVRKLQIIENVVREDVSALEEGEGYRALVLALAEEHPTMSVEERVELIAREIHRKKRHVFSRMALLKLAEPLRQALGEGKIEASHADLLAGLGAKQQMEIFETFFCEYTDGQPAWKHEDDKTKAPMQVLSSERIPSIRELKERLRARGADLKRAPWKLKNDLLTPLCSGCEHNTATAGPDDKKPYCVNRACFEEKSARFLELTLAELTKATGKEPVKCSSSTYGKDKGRLRADQWKKGAKGSCEHLVPLVVYDYGEEKPSAVFLGCATKGCKVHFGEVAPTGESAAQRAAREEQAKNEKTCARETAIRTHMATAHLATLTKLEQVVRFLAARCLGGRSNLKLSLLAGKSQADVIANSSVSSPEFARAAASLHLLPGAIVQSTYWLDDANFRKSLIELGCADPKKLRAEAEKIVDAPPEKPAPAKPASAKVAPKKPAVKLPAAKKAAAKKAAPKKSAKKAGKK